MIFLFNYNSSIIFLIIYNVEIYKIYYLLIKFIYLNLLSFDNKILHAKIIIFLLQNHPIFRKILYLEFVFLKLLKVFQLALLKNCYSSLFLPFQEYKNCDNNQLEKSFERGHFFRSLSRMSKDRKITSVIIWRLWRAWVHAINSTNFPPFYYKFRVTFLFTRRFYFVAAMVFMSSEDR